MDRASNNYCNKHTIDSVLVAWIHPWRVCFSSGWYLVLLNAGHALEINMAKNVHVQVFFLNEMLFISFQFSLLQPDGIFLKKGFLNKSKADIVLYFSCITTPFKTTCCPAHMKKLAACSSFFCGINKSAFSDGEKRGKSFSGIWLRLF